MAELADIRALYEAYIAKVEQLVRDRKPGEGLFGLKGGPADDPCHDKFAADMETLLKEYDGDARAALEYIWFTPPEHREPRSAYWMLVAVHGLALDLIPRLSGAEAEELYARYGETYPRWDRLPVQKRTLDALKKQRKQ